MIPNPQVREWVWEAEGINYFKADAADEIAEFA